MSGDPGVENLRKYDKVFKDCFAIDDAALGPALVYQSIMTWDSVGHMQMVANLEEVFGISMDTEDIIDFSSYEKGKAILAKYGVSL
jgi:acyl carrier protein